MRGLDLMTVFRKEEQVPVVTSVIVNGEASAQLLAVLKSEGFSLDEAQDLGEGVTCYPQDVPYSGDTVIVKLSDTLAVTVPLVKTAGEFAEHCAARGFYPSLNIATELLSCELFKAVEKADTPAAAAQRVASVVSDFGQFMSALVGGLPSVVFKAEQALKANVTVEEPAAPAAVIEAPAQEEQGQGEPGEAPQSEEADPVEQTDNDGEQVEKTEDEGPTKDDIVVEEPAAAPQIDIASIITQVTKGVTEALQPSLDRVQGDVQSIAQRVDAVEQIAKSADEKVGNTVLNGVFGTAPSRDHRQVEKAESSMPLLDTGFRIGKQK